jgi:hypothetical protein
MSLVLGAAKELDLLLLSTSLKAGKECQYNGVNLFPEGVPGVGYMLKKGLD